MRSHAEIARSDDGPALRILEGIDEELEVVFEHPPKALQNAAGQFGIIPLLEQFLERGDAHDEAHGVLGEPMQVSRQAMELTVVGDQHRVTEGGQHVHTVEEVLVIDPSFGAEVLEGHFHQDHQVLAVHVRLLDELRLGVAEHVDGDMGDRPE